MSKSLTKKKALSTLAFAVAVLVTAGAFFGAVRVRRLRYHFGSAQIGFAQLESTLSDPAALASLLQDPGELGEIRADVMALRDDVRAMKELGHPLLALSEHLGWVPRSGGDIKAAPHLLDLADLSSEAALLLIDGVMPLAECLHTDSGSATLTPRILETLELTQPKLQAAQSTADQAGAARQAVEPSHLSPSARRLVDQFDAHQPALSLGLEALQVLPALLGTHGGRRYLILVQNSDELRATGGVISEVGTVEVNQGRISGMVFKDSYAVENLAFPHRRPPDPLHKYLNAEILLLGDANWWPDFPTSAKQIADLYVQDAGPPVDGVISVDLAALKLLVRAMGQIEVPGYPEPVTADKLHSTLMSYWAPPLLVAPGGEKPDLRPSGRDFVGDLVRALLEQVTTQATAEQLVSVTRGLRDALAQRHVLIYVNEPVAQALLHRALWDGALREPQGDFLMVVDSNIGFNKANPNVQQTISYSVNINKTSTVTSQLTLTYQHMVESPLPACAHEARYGDSYQDLMERCYWDYLRVYIPLSSEFVALTGSDSSVDLYVDSGRLVIGTTFLLETGQRRTIELTYRQSLADGGDSYSLIVQKQAGTEAPPVRVTVHPPEHSRLLQLQPEPLAELSDKAVWQGVLGTDWEIAVQWQDAGEPAGR